MSEASDEKMQTGRASELLRAGLLLSFYFVFVDFYRRSYLSTDSADYCLGSPLLFYLPGQPENIWFLNFLHTKAWLFFWMMLCLAAIGACYFSWQKSYSQMVLGGAFVHLIYFVLGDQRLWTPGYLALLVLTLFFLVGKSEHRSFRAGLSTCFSLAALQLLSLCTILPIGWSLFGISLGATAILLWHPKVERGLLLALGVSLFLWGWYHFREHMVLQGLFLLYFWSSQKGLEVGRPTKSSVFLATTLILYQILVLLMAGTTSALLIRLLNADYLEKVEARWEFSSSDGPRIISVEAVARAYNSRPRIRYEDETGQQLWTGAQRNESEVYFSTYWYRDCDLSTLGSPNFYRRLLARSTKFAPSSQAKVKVVITYRGGQTRVREMEL